MLSLLSTWQFNLIAYLVTVVGFTQCFKIAIKHAKHDGPSTVLLQIVSGIFILLFLAFFPFILPTDPKTYVLLLIACFFYALSDRLQTSARKHLQVSVYSIVFQVYNIFLIIYSFVLFKEPLLPTKLLGMMLIIGANILLLYKKGQLGLNTYVYAAVASAFFASTAISLDINNSRNFSLPFYLSLTFLVPALFVSLMGRISLRDLKEEYNQIGAKGRKYYGITSVFWALVIFFSIRSFQFGQVSTLVPLQATSVFINVVIAFFFLHEQDNKTKKIIAAILVVLGISLTVL